MRVLLTGGFGCIGSWIIRNLLSRGDQVWVYDLAPDLSRIELVVPEAHWPEIQFLPGDVCDLHALRQAVDYHNITHIIHLAGLQVPTCRADPLLGARVNVLGSLAVFEAVRLARPQVQQLVYASSAAVFGSPEFYAGMQHPLVEDVPLAPATHYGVFKCCNEGNARIYAQDFGLSSIGLRPWTVYGVGRDKGMTSEPTRAIKAVAVGRSYAISYHGIQDLQFADDVARAFIRALESPATGARVYNLRGSVVDLSVFHAELCTIAPEAADLITVGPKKLTIAYDLDDARFQRDLGPLPVTPLAQGISDTLAAFRDLHARGKLDLTDLESDDIPPLPDSP